MLNATVAQLIGVLVIVVNPAGHQEILYMYVYIYIYMYMYMYVYIYIYTHIIYHLEHRRACRKPIRFSDCGETY